MITYASNWCPMAGESDGDSDPPDNLTKSNCKICGKKAGNNALKCLRSKCNVIVHHGCFELIAKVCNVDKSSWKCKSCAVKIHEDYVQVGEECKILRMENTCLQKEKLLLEKLLTEMEFSNGLMKEKLKGMDANNSELYFNHTGDKDSRSYSGKLKTNVNKEVTTDVVFVKAKDGKISNVQVEKLLKTNFNPSAHNINVVGTKCVKSGVLINCKDENAVNKLKNNLREKLGDAYEIKTPSKFNPRIIIYGVEVTSANDDSVVLDSILGNNDLRVEKKDNVKIIKKFKYKNSYNIIVDVSAHIFQQIIEKSYLYIGWKKCNVKEHFTVMRCYNCSQYGHTQNNCKNNTVCPKCAGSHGLTECETSDNICCINCKLANEKYKLNLSVYRDKVEFLKKRIDYNFVDKS